MPTTFHLHPTTQPTHTKVPYPQEFRRLTVVSIVSSFSVVFRYHILHSSSWMPLFFLGHYEVPFLLPYYGTMQPFTVTLCSPHLNRHYAVLYRHYEVYRDTMQSLYLYHGSTTRFSGVLHPYIISFSHTGRYLVRQLTHIDRQISCFMAFKKRSFSFFPFYD